MKWKRERTEEGLMRYTAGPYTVEERTKGGWWYASGPDMDSEWLRKSEAQAATVEVAKRRIGDGKLGEPVVGDAAQYAGARAVVIALLATNDGTPLYCLRLARGKRQCLLRHEFQVVLP